MCSHFVAANSMTAFRNGLPMVGVEGELQLD